MLEGIKVNYRNVLTIVDTSKNDLMKVSQIDGKVLTTFNFTLKHDCLVDLIVSDFWGNDKEILINNKRSVTGRYAVLWQTNKKEGIYKCLFEAKSDSIPSEIIFSDSIYIVIHTLDTELWNEGYTNSQGVFNTNNKKLFPQLFSLPKFNLTKYAPKPIGYFEISDTLEIILTNTQTNRWQSFKKIINDGENNFQLIWEEALSKKVDAYSENSLNKKIFHEENKSHSNSDLEWELRQNWPNPVD